jgi:allantoinase
MAVDAERKYLTETVQTVSSATGQKIKGWLGPALSETFETPRLLRELALTYLLDWCSDDQPYRLNVPGMMSVPYSIELNDVTLFVSKSLTGEAFYQMVVDQFDQLYKDSEKSGRVMSLALHPFIINQPFRHKYLEKALEYIARRSDVWLTTSDDIAEHYAKTQNT